jgi:hypothetical protein
MKKPVCISFKALFILFSFVVLLSVRADDPAPFDGTASVELSDGDTLILPSGTISLTGDRVISLPGSGVQAIIKIGETAGAGAVTLTPQAGADCILLCDVLAAGSVLEVQLLNNLICQGNGAKPFYFGVRGKGEVRFRIPCGKHITFRSTAHNTAGAHVRILMDQNRAEMEQYSQLSFVPWSGEEDEINTDTSLHSVIEIGQNSSFTFVSQHKSGLVDPTGSIDYGYGCVSFEPFTGTGRMILKIAGGNAAADFKDGAFNIYGNYVAGSGINETDVHTADLRENVLYKYRAGIAATMRINNTIELAQYTEEEASGFLNDLLNRRGLVVLNYNNSYPRLANNYDQTVLEAAEEDIESVVGLTSSKWFEANTVQTGFVLGNNGVIDIATHRFLDYFAGRVNADLSEFPIDAVHVAEDATLEDGTHTAAKVKKHNPSALIVDGYAFRKTGTTAAADPLFEYDSPTTEFAQILLRGSAGVYARVAADSESGVMSNVTIDGDGTQSGDTSNTYVSGTLGRAPYDGSSVMLYTEEGVVDPAISLEGEIAVDVEGPLRIKSTATFDDALPPLGYITLPSILINHRGVELAYDGSDLGEVEAGGVIGARPLSLDPTVEYYRYNNSQILVNDFIILDHVSLHHTDVGRDVSSVGTGDAYPAIIGGELPSLKIAKKLAENLSAWILDYTGSPIFLENSRILCYESLVSAGVRWVVRDCPIDQNRDGEISSDDGETLRSGDNGSVIIFSNRGYAYDLELTGMGRYFQLGSRRNTMADGETLDPLVTSDNIYPQSSLRDAFIDVYRQRPIPTLLREEGTETNSIILQISTLFQPGVPETEKSMHVIHIADRSQINLGWNAGQHQRTETIEGEPVTSTYLEVDSRYAPWEFTNDVLAAVQALDPENEGGYRFSPYEQGVGNLVMSGDLIYIGGAGRYNSVGVLTPASNEFVPRGVRDHGGIVYVNFGGKLSTGGDFDMILNTVIARKTCQINEGGGIVDIPSDQLIFQPHGSITTYGFDVVANPSPSLLNTSNSPIVSINVSELPTPEGFEPVKGFERRSPNKWPYRQMLTRSTDSISGPVHMPTTGMLVMASGDSIDQARICGGTRANPFHLRLSGDGAGFARVREFVSMPSDPVVLGEGPYAALFLDHGARIGLGSRHVDNYSVNAWNQLGLDKVTLFPNGNGVVDLNSDLIITDKLPIVATEAFGHDAVHQLIFTSDVPREIRILAGGELDLSSFGTVGSITQSQQIVFSGHVRLVIEPGAKIRFPSSVTGDNPLNGPILYFNDSSQCIFMGNETGDTERWADGLSGSDAVRSKILGIGQIWLNKQAELLILDNSLVGVEADYDTPKTDVTISIQRQARMLIGNETRAGGAFQVGNIVDGGGDGLNARSVEGARPTQVSFTLKMDGEKANFHIARAGFVGFGAGVVNKSGNPNGTAPDFENAWQLQSLHNVKNITLAITRGYFDHNEIYDGSSSAKNGSVLAIGPLDYNSTTPLSSVNGGRYTLSLGKSNEAFIRGGGNVVYMDAGVPHNDPIDLSILSLSADIIIGGDNNGKYTILAPSPMIRTYTVPIGSETITTTESSYSFASQTVSTIDRQGGALNEFYATVSMPIYGGYKSKFVAAGKSSSGVTAAYLLGSAPTSIIRRDVAVAKDKGTTVSPNLALEKGYFSGTGANRDGGPETLIIP